MRIVYWAQLVVGLVLFGLVVAKAQEIRDRSILQQIRKYDDANINHMKYGIFNVNSWKEKLSKIVISEIQEFELQESNKDGLKKHVENQLTTLIDKVDNQIRENNKGSTKGWFKQKFMEFFVSVDSIKKGVPDYADTIVKEMTTAENQKKLKDVLRGRVEKYLDDTFEKQDLSEVDDIVKRNGQKTMTAAMTFLATTVPIENKNLYQMTWVLLALSIGLFLSLGFYRASLPETHFFLCTATLLVLLYTGIVCPMIDMDAKISSFSFQLLGYPVEFKNQVVYFQSKSIIDVFWILMEDPALSMNILGVLMILFSIVFPLTKILTSVLYFYDVQNCREKKWVQFFALKSGKWSMADVLIVAILMAYIGFNGMVTTQFNAIRKTIPQFTLISTNDTRLQIGLYIFLTYVLLALFLSGKTRAKKT